MQKYFFSFFFIITFTFKIQAQVYCQPLLDDAKIALLQKDLATAQESLKKCDLCDYQNKLFTQRQIVQENIYAAIIQQKKEAVNNFERATQANEALMLSFLKEANDAILQLDYDQALNKVNIAYRLAPQNKKVIELFQELAFVFTETSEYNLANTLLNKINTTDSSYLEKLLPSNKLPSGERRDLLQKIQQLNSTQYNNLLLRYYPNMVLIKGGNFIMGCNELIDINCEEDLEKPHTALVSNYFLANTEITNWQFYLYSKSTQQTIESPDWQLWGDNPIVNVTWEDAISYANWLSKQWLFETVINIDNKTYSFDHSLNGVRLPTETEWEYAARGGTNKDDFIYAGSNNLSSVGLCNDSEIITNTNRTQAVAQLKANRLKLFDMSGNVSEWCWDWHANEYPEKAPLDYKGPEKGFGRVLRGGSWNDDPVYLRCTHRKFYFGNYKDTSTGFRVAMSTK